MKRFFRSAIGKTVLFIGCVTTTLLLIGSLFLIDFYFEGDVYSKTQQQIYNEVIQQMIYQDSIDAVNQLQTLPEKAVIEDKGNLVYEVVDGEGKTIAKSESAFEQQNWSYSNEYGIKDVHGINAADNKNQNQSFTVNATLKEPLEVNDKYQLVSVLVKIGYALKYIIYLLAIAFVLIDVFSFVGLMSNIGKNQEDDQLHAGAFAKVPFDLLLVLFGLLVPVSLEGIDMCQSEVSAIFYCIIVLTIMISLLLGLISSFAIRVKTHTLIVNTITYKLLVLLKKIIVFTFQLIKGFLLAIPLVWKVVIGMLIIFIANWAFHYSWSYELLKVVILLPIAVFLALNLHKLKKAGEQLANGDLSAHVNTKGLIADFKNHGEHLNEVGKGMAIAVEDRLKSERMKTELITNVSHDIKTPLTSIINYASLISKEETDNEKIKEYSEVLVRQSNKLKRLIEDLVEASKASTGNLEVFLAPCDANVFLAQAAGEYEEKMHNYGLNLVTKQSEKEIRIMADGRRMWRIFDNLMNNICKYAQTDTRVYLSIEEVDQEAVITFKNTSRDQLDMTEEELMERFTRGDHSRNTEGNGLGLNIARSLAELQNGSLSLEIDGDLFKAILKFPII